jgi:Carboxypeptidase regulatory-like domain
MKRIISIIWLISLSFCISAQTGGTFNLTHSVIASGGGSNSTGGQFSVSGTIGQPSAGTISTGSNFSLSGGFWAFDSFAPTAALVSISGRVLTNNGQGIRNVRVTLTNGSGLIRTIQTTSFGNFRFEEIEAEQTYILEVSSKKFVFANPTRILSVQEEIADADFVANGQ